jgi:hypothetical protein
MPIELWYVLSRLLQVYLKSLNVLGLAPDKQADNHQSFTTLANSVLNQQHPAIWQPSSKAYHASTYTCKRGREQFSFDFRCHSRALENV